MLSAFLAFLIVISIVSAITVVLIPVMFHAIKGAIYAFDIVIVAAFTWHFVHKYISTAISMGKFAYFWDVVFTSIVCVAYLFLMFLLREKTELGFWILNYVMSFIVVFLIYAVISIIVTNGSGFIPLLKFKLLNDILSVLIVGGLAYLLVLKRVDLLDEF